MASIDHTCLVYLNGKNIEENYPLFVDGYLVYYTRDGEVSDVFNGTEKSFYDARKVDGYKNVEFKHIFVFDAYHYEDYSVVIRNKLIREFLEKILPKKKVEDTYIKYFSNECLEIYCYVNKTFNVSFIFGKENSYVILGGYGHYQNPYTHFMHRGYGKDFEQKMVKECYRWLCDSIFKDEIVRTITNWDDEENICKGYWDLLKYKDWYDMTEEERKEEFK
jgi:hypothetical protein